MFTIRKNKLDEELNNRRIMYKGYVAIEYMRDGKIVVWNGGKSYII